MAATPTDRSEPDHTPGRARGMGPDALEAVTAGLYEGVVRHRRHLPRTHVLRRRVFYPLVDVADSAWWADLPLGVRFRRADYLGNPATPLATALRDLVQDELGWRPAGSVWQLAHLRTWGWCFNPLAVYWCGDGERRALVLEVTNTPWHERHGYVLDVSMADPPWRRSATKALHVSPFLGMDLTYRVRATAPGPALHVGIDVDRAGTKLFDADLVLRRHPFDRRTWRSMLLRHPAMPLRGSAAIHVEAAKLWVKGVPVHRHPGRS